MLRRLAGELESRIAPGVSSLPKAEWEACFPGEAEGWPYYCACEGAPGGELEFSAAEVRDDEGLLAAAPLFELVYTLDTQFQGTMGRVAGMAARALPSLAKWRLLGVGSPLAERCHIALRPGLSEAQRRRALAKLVETVEAEARRRGAAAVVYKDLQGQELAIFAAELRRSRYVGVNSLPVAVLELGDGAMDSYLTRLSAATRKDVRRKLRKSSPVRIERCTDIEGVAAEVDRLHFATRMQSDVRYGEFEELPEGYFRSVARELNASRLGGSAMFILYWVGRELAAFNLLLIEPDRVIDKYLGMRYPLAREHNLYVVSWMENVRFCLETGRRRLQSGQTAYESKVRLGSRLQPSMLFVKHRNRAINRMLQFAAPLAAFDLWDPHLRRLRKGRKLS